MATKTVKKVAAPSPAKVVKAVKEKKVMAVEEKKITVKFVSFTLGATIPTQSFGNIQPHLTVEAGSYEDAAAFAFPIIEGLYAKYADVKPGFLGKITETVKEVAVTATVVPVAKVAVQVETVPTTAPDAVKSEFVLKAEKMIRLAMSGDAAFAIQDQIEKSVKIAEIDKPALIVLVLKNRGEFK